MFRDREERMEYKWNKIDLPEFQDMAKVAADADDSINVQQNAEEDALETSLYTKVFCNI